MITTRTISIGVAIALVALVFQPTNQRITTLGFRRPLSKIANIHGHELKIIKDTPECEDVHHHRESNTLFLACQFDGFAARQHWFPGLGSFRDPSQAGDGGIVVVDPETFESTRLTLKKFSGPLVTHGFDVVSDPSQPEKLYIFVINELPNPKHFVAPGTVNKAEKKWRSQVEVFTHILGGTTATWQRSVRHPAIDLPNDIYIISPTSFYATNDHYYGDGRMRPIEDLLEQHTAPWSNTVLVNINEPNSADPEGGISVRTALRGLHNNNGLGHGAPSRPDEVLLTDAAGGVLHRAQRRDEDSSIKLIEAIQLDSTIDNPTWYEDIYATGPDSDASAYLLAGLVKGANLPKYTQTGVMHPSLVWSVRPLRGINSTSQKVARWEKKLIFQDNGKILRSASAAVIVGINPKKNGGKKQGWLFTTGFLSEAMVATRIDL